MRAIIIVACYVFSPFAAFFVAGGMAFAGM